MNELGNAFADGLILLALTLTSVSVVDAQQLRGRVIDSANGGPVGLAGVFLLNAERDMVADEGEYYLVDDCWWQNEHIEEIDMDAIGVVVVPGGSVYLYAGAFDWTMRTNGGLVPGRVAQPDATHFRIHVTSMG